MENSNNSQEIFSESPLFLLLPDWARNCFLPMFWRPRRDWNQGHMLNLLYLHYPMLTTRWNHTSISWPWRYITTNTTWPMWRTWIKRWQKAMYMRLSKKWYKMLHAIQQQSETTAEDIGIILSSGKLWSPAEVVHRQEKFQKPSMLLSEVLMSWRRQNSTKQVWNDSVPDGRGW